MQCMFLVAGGGARWFLKRSVTGNAEEIMVLCIFSVSPVCLCFTAYWRSSNKLFERKKLGTFLCCKDSTRDFFFLDVMFVTFEPESKEQASVCSDISSYLLKMTGPLQTSWEFPSPRWIAWNGLPFSPRQGDLNLAAFPAVGMVGAVRGSAGIGTTWKRNIESRIAVALPAAGWGPLPVSGSSRWRVSHCRHGPVADGSSARFWGLEVLQSCILHKKVEVVIFNYW